ncbi:fatty acid metabolism regulator protein [Geomonas limicola]|uniref:Fatty acid metabolism regulator protein n=1 Tax=Geomonas limicola TaxID=2740186 RepID=A0A6V8NBK4_9BACT|nr:GntR family transcriptional regulator [Geomonas limicola]GFO69896.1 fatty acid metabolism regulator protein [Geomonas limicola]
MKKSYEVVEKALVDAFLKGNPQPGCHLASERDLAAQFSVSRATVREALLKLQQSGWISVQQRHATVVNNFWSQGDLELLSSIIRNSEHFPADLASNLLELRLQFAPDYARRAVQNEPEQLQEHLVRSKRLSSGPGAISRYDWELHLKMAIWSGNKIYPLIMNSFADLYFKLRGEFFAREEHRSAAREFYRALLQATLVHDAAAAEAITRSAMQQRLDTFRHHAAESGSTSSS